MRTAVLVAPREGRVSRNSSEYVAAADKPVAPREGRVSRNFPDCKRCPYLPIVAPREGRVSRNLLESENTEAVPSRAPRGACE